MTVPTARLLTAAVEGITDEAAVRKLAGACGFGVDQVYVSHGKSQLDRRLPSYNAAARHRPWLILRDLDHDADCPPELLGDLIPRPSDHLVLRVPVRSLEAWLLADHRAISGFLGVGIDKIPRRPEALSRPKRTLVDLARNSRKQAIRQDMVPATGVSAEVGAGYSARLIEFIETHWDPYTAASRSVSLRRSIRALETAAETGDARREGR